MSASFWTFYPNRMAWINQKMLAVKWRCWCLHFALEIHSNSRPKTQNNYKNVWICPECVITKECPETFLLFLYKTPLFPRLVQVLRICFLSLSLPPSVFPFLPLPPSPSLSLSLSLSLCLPLCLWRCMNTTKGWFIGERQYELSVFKGAHRARVLWETSRKENPGSIESYFRRKVKQRIHGNKRATQLSWVNLLSTYCKLLPRGTCLCCVALRNPLAGRLISFNEQQTAG